jgi:hypothetical protein
VLYKSEKQKVSIYTRAKNQPLIWMVQRFWKMITGIYAFF